MSILSTLGYGVSLLIELVRSQTQPRLSVPDSSAAIPLARLPDSHALAGVPLRILLSDRSGPGGLLRDTLMTQPYTHD